MRSNFIVGFPGETEEEFGELVGFLERARLDVIGVFGYSDEDGTEAAGFDGKLDQEVVDERVRVLTELAEELTAQRAEERIGTRSTCSSTTTWATAATRAGPPTRGPRSTDRHGAGHRPGRGQIVRARGGRRRGG